MRISTLISELTRLHEQYGNIPVYVENYLEPREIVVNVMSTENVTTRKIVDRNAVAISFGPYMRMYFDYPFDDSELNHV